ncbi:hypothetical protein QCA50_008457 [Cerrena zonata]|uniref:F-box domain-containing protein n=1 Tax=Cerrena zonata TaxID=2478898 RepID=A0AAW0G6P7_9APHY
MSTVHFSRPGQGSLRLPAEMMDYIIDFLHEDKPSLSSCSLVARAFVASSQSHLFRRLSCGWEEGLGHTYIAPFFRKHTHLQVYVKGIHIAGLSERYSKPPGPSREICMCVIIEILSTFPRLCVFGLDELDIVWRECCSYPPTTQSFRPIDIECLYLVDVNLPDPIIAVKYLKLFKNIQRLHIIDVYIFHYDYGLSDIGTMTNQGSTQLLSNWSPSLAQLAITRDQGREEEMLEPFADLLAARNTLRNIEELDIVCRDSRDFFPAADITRASNKGLKKLRIDVATALFENVSVDTEEEMLSVAIDPSEWKCLELSSFHSVQSFETSVMLLLAPLWESPVERFPNIQPGVQAFKYFLDFLSEVPRSIKYITIYLNLKWVGPTKYTEAVSQDYDWDRLITIIHSLPAIESVDLILLTVYDFTPDVAAQCQKIVMDVLDRKNQGERRVIRVLYEEGNHDEFSRANIDYCTPHI